MALYLYRVLDTDDDGDPIDHGVVKALSLVEAKVFLEAHLAEILGPMLDEEYKDRIRKQVQKNVQTLLSTVKAAGMQAGPAEVKQPVMVRFYLLEEQANAGVLAGVLKSSSEYVDAEIEVPVDITDS